MSNETKQTAVEWLLDRIEDVDLTEKLWENVKQQAKEMEKERELNAYANGQADTLLMFKQKISKIKDIPTEFNQIISENFWDLV
jgi:chlorite dismutase